MPEIGNFEKYFGTPEQRRARFDANLKKDMAKIDAQFEPLRKLAAERPKLDMFTKLEPIKPKPSLGNRIIQKFVNVLKMLKR